MWDIIGKATNQPLYKLLGGAVRKQDRAGRVHGHSALRRGQGDRAGSTSSDGFTTLKTKAGRRAEEDLEMVRGIRDGVGDRLKLRIDPNMGYAPEVAFPLARDLEKYNLEYFEQPMPFSLHRRVGPAAPADQDAAGPERIGDDAGDRRCRSCKLHAADVLLPDTYQCGGILGVKKVAALCEAAGVPCVFHCAHDLGLKTAAMLHVVASTPNFPLANDCTYYGLADDIITPLHRIERGFMEVPEGPGLGVKVDEAKVARFRI